MPILEDFLDEDEYWYSVGWEIGYEGLEDIRHTINPVFLKDYDAGVEDGEYAFEVDYDTEFDEVEYYI